MAMFYRSVVFKELAVKMPSKRTSATPLCYPMIIIYPSLVIYLGFTKSPTLSV